VKRPEDEANVCAPDDTLVDRHVLGRVSELGKGGVGDGAKVGVFAEPEVLFGEHAMVDARRA
jgi:hypothetical protein